MERLRWGHRSYHGVVENAAFSTGAWWREKKGPADECAIRAEVQSATLHLHGGCVAVEWHSAECGEKSRMVMARGPFDKKPPAEAGGLRVPQRPVCHADPGSPNDPVSPGFRPGLFGAGVSPGFRPGPFAVRGGAPTDKKLPARAGGQRGEGRGNLP